MDSLSESVTDQAILPRIEEFQYEGETFSIDDCGLCGLAEVSIRTFVKEERMREADELVALAAKHGGPTGAAQAAASLFGKTRLGNFQVYSWLDHPECLARALQYCCVQVKVDPSSALERSREIVAKYPSKARLGSLLIKASGEDHIKNFNGQIKALIAPLRNKAETSDQDTNTEGEKSQTTQT